MACEMKTLQWIIRKIYIVYDTNLKVKICMKITLVVHTKQSTNWRVWMVEKLESNGSWSNLALDWQHTIYWFARIS